MFESFQPTLLVSMPQLQDPNFARAVVLLCDYMPDGAFGLVLNRPTDLPATTMVKLEPAVADGNALPLCIGGPVEPDRGWILLADAPEESDYRTICEGVYLSTSPVLLRRVLSTSPAPRARVLAGYAGWGPGVAHRPDRPRSRVRHRTGTDVGDSYPPAGRRPLIPADESWGALTSAQGSRLRAQGSGLRAQGSGLKEEHSDPGRATEI
jgi:putative transcriptional regulator